MRFLGFDFLHASASAKLINTATNLAAVGLFAALGHVWWPLALSMAVGNVLGSLLGTRIALKGGAVLVRRVRVLVLVAVVTVCTVTCRRGMLTCVPFVDTLETFGPAR